MARKTRFLVYSMERRFATLLTMTMNLLQISDKKPFLLGPNSHPKIAGMQTSPPPLRIERPHWTQNGPSWADKIAGTHLHPYTVPLAPYQVATKSLRQSLLVRNKDRPSNHWGFYSRNIAIGGVTRWYCLDSLEGSSAPLVGGFLPPI